MVEDLDFYLQIIGNVFTTFLRYIFLDTYYIYIFLYTKRLDWMCLSNEFMFSMGPLITLENVTIFVFSFDANNLLNYFYFLYI